MTKHPPAQVSGPAGDYEIKLGIEYDETLSPDVVWTAQATVGNSGDGSTKQTDDGTMRGRVVLTGIAADAKIGIGIAPDIDGSEFKVMRAKVRVARLT